MPQHLLIIALTIFSTFSLSISGFHIPYHSLQLNFRHSCQRKNGSKLILSVGNNDNGKEIVQPSSSDEDKVLYKELRQRNEEIQIEKTRDALEEQHTKSFLRKMPVKLPYDQARKWVQANLGVNTKEEFDDFVAMGYIQTPYIPKNPEKYYTRTREWVSWDHFLNGMAAIEQQRGAFD